MKSSILHTKSSYGYHVLEWIINKFDQTQEEPHCKPDGSNGGTDISIG